MMFLFIVALGQTEMDCTLSFQAFYFLATTPVLQTRITSSQRECILCTLQYIPIITVMGYIFLVTLYLQCNNV